MTSPFDIIRHMSEKTPLEFNMKEYSPYIINRGLTNMLDTIFFAEVMNKYYHLSKEIQYKFYSTAIPKGKRFGKWHKADAINTNIEMLMEYYQVNRKVAESYLKVMSDEAINLLKEKNNKGGRK